MCIQISLNNTLTPNELIEASEKEIEAHARTISYICLFAVFFKKMYWMSIGDKLSFYPILSGDMQGNGHF